LLARDAVRQAELEAARASNREPSIARSRRVIGGLSSSSRIHHES
jgi:hypothetical protein